MGVIKDFFSERGTNEYAGAENGSQSLKSESEIKEYMYAVSNNGAGYANSITENVSFNGKFALLGAGLGFIYGIVKQKNLFVTIGAGVVLFGGGAYLITNVIGKNKAVINGNEQENKYKL